MTNGSMLCTPEDLINTPSRDDGIPQEKEERYRRDGARFIRDLGTTLSLAPTTFCTGIALYHRFFIKHSYKQYNRWHVAAACLFFGAKSEEQPKKLKDFIPAYAELKAKGLNQAKPTMDAMAYRTHRDKLLNHERFLLQEMEFDVHIEHPFPILINIAKKVLPAKDAKAKQIVQEAWTYVTDSYMTCLCLLHKPEVIAVAMLRASSIKHEWNLTVLAQGADKKKTNVTTDDKRPWWTQLGIKADDAVLQGIADELHRTYDILNKVSPKIEPSPNPQSPKVAKNSSRARPSSKSQ
eukprot:TRINITY_DN10198_c0_g1_i1.p1 TRINITY_DN10198_c0_g1~~TRINITY_DN10198_c0_g1_i1.p1  ORF type:complete len:294 (+),score=52.40 TRINITY_DN10198_c0_g1_i1:35-916(+)